jgi:hypothetical protein
MNMLAVYMHVVRFICSCGAMRRATGRSARAHRAPSRFHLVTLACLQTTVGSTHKHKPVPLVAHSDAPYARNIGGVVGEHQANQTMIRPRAYGVGNGINSKPFESNFYTQPGLSIDPRYTRPPREVRVSVRRLRAV